MAYGVKDREVPVMKLEHYLSPYTKVNPKWLRPKVKQATIKLFGSIQFNHSVVSNSL